MVGGGGDKHSGSPLQKVREKEEKGERRERERERERERGKAKAREGEREVVGRGSCSVYFFILHAVQGIILL